MQKIKKLSDQEARKIAAGEVVERPSNIVKELIENSIDAGASNIFIYIEDAGKKLIKIIDNGCGMSEEDAVLCFEHHATSKIQNIEDLNTLNTFGFRGEALSSISSISNVTLITKEDDDSGIKVNVEFGKIISQEKFSCPQGTEIIIENMFSNVPARLKFLKKSETEWRQIVQLFHAFCLSNLNIHFKLFHNSLMIYNCPIVNNLKNRVAQLWDHNFSENMVDIELDQKNDFKINGLISNQQFFRYNRNQIFFFVNGRWIKNYNLCKALLKGYLNVLPADKFPAAFIFINIEQNQIDINVHPRKEEVQFLNPKKIETSIQELVKNSLEKNLLGKNEIKNLEQNSNNFFKPSLATTIDFENITFFEPINPALNTSFKNNYVENLVEKNSLDQKKITYQNDTLQMTIRDYKLIGQFKNTYILLEKSQGLILIDQHAAHERIMYELFAKKFNEVATVKLIFPYTISINENDIETLIKYIDILQTHGIEIERFAKDKLIVQSVPVYLKDVNLSDLIQELVTWIDENETLERIEFFKIINEKLRAQMACKAAIKAGDILTEEQIYKLIDDLESVDNRITCPHGRPTSWVLSLYEIEKKFKRKA